MKLMTKKIEQQARAQYPQGNNLDQMVVAKFFDPCSQWTWYLMNQDPDDPDYLWGIVRGYEIEIGSFSLSELASVKNGLGLNMERDLYFTPRPAREILQALENGQHI